MKSLAINDPLNTISLMEITAIQTFNDGEIVAEILLPTLTSYSFATHVLLLCWVCQFGFCVFTNLASL